MRNLRLEGTFLISPGLPTLRRSKCLRVQRSRRPQQKKTGTACIFGIGKREQEVIQVIEPEAPLPERCFQDPLRGLWRWISLSQSSMYHPLVMCCLI